MPGRRGFFGFFGFGALLAASACAAHVFVPPTGSGAPAPEAAAAWAEATAACRNVKNASGNLRVTLRRGRFGSAGLTVTVIVTSDGHIRLEDSAAFHLAGTAARAELLLRQDGRLVTARAEDIVDALVGVRLGPERLLAILSGCVTTSPSSAHADSGVRFGARIAIPANDGRVFLAQQAGKWRVAAGEADGVIVEYRGGVSGAWPLAWRAAPAAAGAASIMLDVAVADLEVNAAAIDPAAFRLNLPPDATPMTLEELRAWARGKK